MQRWFGDRPNWPLFTNLVGHRRQWNKIGSLKMRKTIYFLKRLGVLHNISISFQPYDERRSCNVVETEFLANYTVFVSLAHYLQGRSAKTCCLSEPERVTLVNELRRRISGFGDCVIISMHDADAVLWLMCIIFVLQVTCRIASFRLSLIWLHFIIFISD